MVEATEFQLSLKHPCSCHKPFIRNRTLAALPGAIKAQFSPRCTDPTSCIFCPEVAAPAILHLRRDDTDFVQLARRLYDASFLSSVNKGSCRMAGLGIA